MTDYSIRNSVLEAYIWPVIGCFCLWSASRKCVKGIDFPRVYMAGVKIDRQEKQSFIGYN